MKKIITWGILTSLIGVSCAQSDQKKSDVVLPADTHGRYTIVADMLQQHKPDTLAIRQYLEEWEAQDPKNVDLCTCWSNLYLSRSLVSPLQLNIPQGEGMYNMEVDKESQMITLKDSLGNIKGYITPGQTFFSVEYFDKAIAKLDEGLALNPNRLDIWMGKTHAFLMKKDFDKACQNIFLTLRRAKEVGNGWLWTENGPLKEKSFESLSSMTDYAVDMMEADKVTEALQVMDSLIAFRPDYSAFKLVKGDICAKKKLDKDLIDAIVVHDDYDHELDHDAPLSDGQHIAFEEPPPLNH